MRFKVGQKVRVVKPYTQSGFKDGDIVEISKIEDEGSDCPYYKAKLCSNEQVFWYLNEDEVEPIESEDKAVPITNGDKIRSMSNYEIAKLLHDASHSNLACKYCPHRSNDCSIDSCNDGFEAWLNSPAE